MSLEAVGRLIDKWLEDPAFRQQLRKDPEGTARQTGARLSDEEGSALRNIDWHLPDEELTRRASKLFA